MPTPSPENRFPRRPLSNEIKKRLIAKSGGKCAICGAKGIALDVSHILPMAFGGTNTESNLLLLCPNCHRSFDLRPHETEFIHYLATLLRSDREYSSVQVEPLVKTADRQLRPDLLAIWDQGKASRQVLIECKNLSTFSAAQLERVIDQLNAYKRTIRPDEVALAFPGRIHDVDKARLVAESIAVWDLDYIANKFASAIAANHHPYFQTLFQAASGRADTPHEPTLSEKLGACAPGTANWPVYQKLIGQILEHLFCPPLESPIFNRLIKPT